MQYGFSGITLHYPWMQHFPVAFISSQGGLVPENPHSHLQQQEFSLLLMQFPEYQVTGTTVSEEITSWNITGNEEPFHRLNTGPSSRDPLTLSRGELRRLELACILSRESDLLILDEPYASLDQAAKPELTELLEQRTGITLIFSHETEYLPTTAEHWTIQEGKLHRD